MDLTNIMQSGLNTHSLDKFLRHSEALGYQGAVIAYTQNMIAGVLVICF